MIDHPAGPPRRWRWTWAVLLGVLGYLVNLFPLQLSPGTDLIFGNVPSLLAAVVFGPAAGLTAAAIASVRTIWLWNHAYALLIFAAEAFFVGYLTTRRGFRPLVADALYWFVLGVPLLVLTYHLVMGVSGDTFVVIALKQTFNGLVSTIIVEMLLLLQPLRRLLRLPTAPRLVSTLAAVVTLLAVMPTLGFGIWSGREEWARNVGRAEDRLQLASRAYAAQLEQYVRLHANSVRSVAQGSELRGEFIPEQLQRLVLSETRQFSGFVSMYAADAEARTVAFTPVVLADGSSALGRDYSDRLYFQQLRESRSTVVSEPLIGRGTAEPVVVIAHPIVLGGTLTGFVAGAISLNSLPPPEPPPAATARLRVADAGGVLVYDSRARSNGERISPEPVDSMLMAQIAQPQGAGIVYYQGESPVAAAAVVAAQLIAGVARIPSLGWWVWVEQPVAEIQADVSRAYIRLLVLLIVVTLLALLVSDLLSNYLARPLLRLQAATAALARGAQDARVGAFAGAVPVEVRALGDSFDRMADALAAYTRELEELGEITGSLASTLDADELLRLVTDATVRLVRADGCGILLRDETGDTLRAAEHSLGLLASAAGRHIPLDAPPLPEVVRDGRSVLLTGEPAAAFLEGQLGDHARIGSLIAVPLSGRSGPLGTLVAVRAETAGPAFSLADLRLLDRLARTAAVAVENARLIEAAQAASHAKSDFIATMSHELRTPLNAVLGHLELLQMEIHGPLGPPQKEALGRIAVAARHLRGLIEEVLSFSRVEAGRVDVNIVPTDLRALAEEVASVIEPLATEKGLRLHTRATGPDEPVATDADKIRQILINLAGNAVKFTDVGEVEIHVEIANGTVALAVRDTGPGIPTAQQARLFRPFEQLETGLARSHGGTGLGLYLSSRYAALIGGRIEVRSEEGKGSEFRLVLPRTERSSEG